MSTIRLLGWLLRNELRLWWRKTTGAKQFWAWALMIGLGVLSLLVILWLGLGELRAQTGQVALATVLLWPAVGLWLYAFIFAFNQSMGESVVVLFERGDLDLLLSSPLPGRVIFAVRLLSLALTTFFGFSLFVVPASVLAVLVGFPELLGVYPALASVCLVATSLAMLVTLGVVRWVGARRARSLVQILNLLMTLLIVLVFQIPNLLQSEALAIGPALAMVQGWVTAVPWLRADSWLWFPARALWFDAGSVALSLGVSGAIAALAVLVLERAFIRGTQQSVSQKQQARPGQAVALRDGFRRVVLAKEWRMMRRNPFLISQVALQVVLVVPLTFVLLQNDGNRLLDAGSIASFAVPFLAGQLAYVMTFVCLSGEEAADLLKASPAAGRSLRGLKQLAALIPVWVVVVPVFVVLMLTGVNWGPALVAGLGASMGASFLRLWNSRPVPPGEMFRRRSSSKADFWLGIIEVASPLAWGSLGGALYARAWWGVLVWGGCLGVLFLLGYWRGRQLGSLLQY